MDNALWREVYNIVAEYSPKVAALPIGSDEMAALWGDIMKDITRAQANNPERWPLCFAAITMLENIIHKRKGEPLTA